MLPIFCFHLLLFLCELCAVFVFLVLPTCKMYNMSYTEHTSRDLTQRYREHIRYIRNQSAYAQHILRNQHEYGQLQTVWLHLNQYTRPHCWYPSNNSSYRHIKIMVLSSQQNRQTKSPIPASHRHRSYITTIP